MKHKENEKSEIRDIIAFKESRLAKRLRGVWSGFEQQVNEIEKVQRMENELASASSWAFVRAFSYTAKQICYCRPTPNTENYISLAKQALEMLNRGYDPADVLLCFDILLERERGR